MNLPLVFGPTNDRIISLGGFPNEIKTKIISFVIIILSYKNMITTNNKISYFAFNNIGNPPII